MLIISIDYDNTYTDDPETFNKIIDILKNAGHVVVMVTARPPTDPIEHKLNIDVYYTSSIPKGEYMNNIDLMPDIWIDDWPEIIGKTRFYGH